MRALVAILVVLSLAGAYAAGRYGRGDDPDRPPLAVGLFVEAEISGRVLHDVVRLPRAALRGSDEIAVVNDAGRVELRRVEVLRRDRHHVLIAAGIASQERVIDGPLAVTVNGMRVRILERPQGPSLTGRPPRQTR